MYRIGQCRNVITVEPFSIMPRMLAALLIFFAMIAHAAFGETVGTARLSKTDINPELLADLCTQNLTQNILDQGYGQVVIPEGVLNYEPEGICFLSTYQPLTDQKTSLTAKDFSGLVQSISRCWIIDFDNASRDIVLELGVAFNKQGKVVPGSLRFIKSRGGTKEAAEMVFDKARRAILRCQKDGYQSLPKSYSGEEIIIVFDQANF